MRNAGFRTVREADRWARWAAQERRGVNVRVAVGSGFLVVVSVKGRETVCNGPRELREAIGG